jgi:hypothetical protein
LRRIFVPSKFFSTEDLLKTGKSFFGNGLRMHISTRKAETEGLPVAAREACGTGQRHEQARHIWTY